MVLGAFFCVRPVGVDEHVDPSAALPPLQNPYGKLVPFIGRLPPVTFGRDAIRPYGCGGGSYTCVYAFFAVKYRKDDPNGKDVFPL